MKRLVASLFVLLLVLVSAAPALAGCAPWCTPRCHAACKEVVCYKVTGEFHAENGMTTFTITDITDDQGVRVPALMGMTFEVSKESDLGDLDGVLADAFKAHFTYQPSGSQITLHQPPAPATATE